MTDDDAKRTLSSFELKWQVLEVLLGQRVKMIVEVKKDMTKYNEKSRMVADIFKSTLENLETVETKDFEALSFVTEYLNELQVINYYFRCCFECQTTLLHCK